MLQRYPAFFFYVFVGVLFFADISLATLFNYPYVSLLLCFYCALLFATPRATQVGITLTLLASESLFFHGRFGLTLIYLLPALLIAPQLRRLLLISRLPAYLVLLACLGAEMLILEPFVLGFPLSLFYAGIKICVSLIMLILLLKYAF